LLRSWAAILSALIWCQHLHITHCLLPDPLEGFPGGHHLKGPKALENLLTSGAVSHTFLKDPSTFFNGPWHDTNQRPQHTDRQDSKVPSSDALHPAIERVLKTPIGELTEEVEDANPSNGQLSFVEQPDEHADPGGPIDWGGFGRALFPDEWFPSGSGGASDASDTSTVESEAPVSAKPSPTAGAKPNTETPSTKKIGTTAPGVGSTVPDKATPIADPAVKPKAAAKKASSGLPTLTLPLSDLPLLQPFKGLAPNKTFGPLDALVPALGLKSPLDEPLPADAGSRVVPTFDKSAEEKCRGKRKGFNADPDSTTCFLWCMGTSPNILDGVPRGFRSCCPLGMCFQAASLLDPLGKCGPCPPGEPAPPPPVAPTPVAPVVVTRQPGMPVPGSKPPLCK
jgi:hypothetical protein